MSAERVEKAAARRCGWGIPRTRKVLLTGPSNARDPCRRRVKAMSALASQQTGACGAGKAGSTKGMHAPRAGARGVAADARQLLSALQTTGALTAAPAQAVVTLIVGVAP